MPAKPLNSKEVKEIIRQIKEQWDAKDIDLNYSFFLSGKDKVYIINKEIVNYEMGNLRINSIGLYFGELVDDSLRLSIEGSQIVGKFARKNVVEVDSEIARKWLKGEQIEIDGKELKGFVIIRHQNDFLGSGKFSQGKILNYVPKTRRIRASD